ncbi:MAG: hypothetical protein E6R04_05285 [Spirochaetes bacterium]|nr:MAG: hypothetical protein E6R04_05285 [Spirochaetota bacterium]
MPAVTFTVPVKLLDYGNQPRVGVKLVAAPIPAVKKDSEAAYGTDPEAPETDENGQTTFTLISLPGLWYRISGKGVNAVRFAAYIPDPEDPRTGTVFPPGHSIPFEDIMDESPTPGYEAIAYMGGGGGGAVDSVNGETSVVVLDAADVGADPAGTAAFLVGALTIPDSPDDIGAATAAQGAKADTAVQPAALTAYATDAELAVGLGTKANTSHGHVIADTTGLQAALDAKADDLGADDNYVTDAEKAALHAHSNKAALDLVSGTNTGDQVLPTWSTISGKPAVVAAGATQADARTAIGAGTSSLAIGTTGSTAAAGNRAATETATGMVELATTAEATTGTDTVRAVTPAGVKAVADTKANVSHTHTASQVSDSTTTGRALLTAVDAAAARTALGLGTAATTASTAYATAAQGAKADTAVQPAALTAYATDAELASGLATKANTSHGHAIADTTGLQAALDAKADDLGADDNYVTDAEKAALHAHSNKAALDLVSGTNTGDQVLPTWSTISGKPAVVAAGATQADARTAIGAGTSSLAIGTTGSTAAAGNRAATETATGMVELATTTEATTGTDTVRAVTPAGVKAVADTKANVSHTHTASQVSDSTTTGRALLTAADAPAARTALSLGDAATKNTGTTAGTLAAGDDARIGKIGGTVTVSGTPTAGQVPIASSGTAAAWGAVSGGGGGASVAWSGVNVGGHLPVWANGGYATFSMITTRIIPCPLVAVEAMNVDAVSIYVGTGVATSTVDLALYTYDLTTGKPGSFVQHLATIDTSTSGIKTATFTPIALAAGIHVVIGRANNANVTLRAVNGSIGVIRMHGPDGNNNQYGFPHATWTGAVPSWPTTPTWDWSAGVHSVSGAVPKLQLRRSA